MNTPQPCLLIAGLRPSVSIRRIRRPPQQAFDGIDLLAGEVGMLDEQDVGRQSENHRTLSMKIANPLAQVGITARIIVSEVADGRTIWRRLRKILIRLPHKIARG